MAISIINKNIKRIDSFIKENLSEEKNYNKSLNELEKLCEFIKQIKICLSIDELITLIKNNPILTSLLKMVVEHNVLIIKKGKIDIIFDNEILISLIEAYCIISDITIELDSEYTSDFEANLETDVRDNDLKGNNEDLKEDVFDEDDYESISAFSMYMIEIHQDNQLLKRAEEFELSKRIAEGDEEARNILIERNLRLVPPIAKKHRGKGLKMEDLVQEGNLGLIDAALKFDYKKGYRFSTYATHLINDQIRKAIKDKGRNIRIPLNAHETITKILKDIEELKALFRREPTLEEISEKSGIALERVKELIRAYPDTLSLNTLVSDEKDTELIDFIESDNEPSEDIVINKELAANLRKIIESLPRIKERDKQIFIMLFGLDGKCCRSRKNVGEIYQLTSEGIRQIEIKIIKKLRTHPKIKELAIFTDNPEKSLERLADYNAEFYKKVYKRESSSSSKEKTSSTVDKIRRQCKKNNIRVSKKNARKKSNRLYSIYVLLDDYSREEIDYVISILDQYDKKLLRKRYGDDLDNPVTSSDWSKDDNTRFYSTLLPRIKRLLKKVRKMTKRNELIEKCIEPTSLSENIENIDDIYNLYISSLLDNQIIDKYGIKEIIIYLLCTYGVNGRCFSIKEIAEFLNINELEIIDILKKSLISFGENLENSLLSKLISLLNINEIIILSLMFGAVNGKYYSNEELAKFLDIPIIDVIKTIRTVLLTFKKIGDFSKDSYYFGITNFLEINTFIKESMLDVESACLELNLDEETINLILLIYAREHYIEGFSDKGDEFLKVVESYKNKSPKVRIALNEIRNNKKLYGKKTNEHDLELTLSLKPKNTNFN